MSLWSEIQDRSCGISRRKEDEYHEKENVNDLISPRLILDEINDIKDLPPSSAEYPGKIYILGADCGVYYKGDIIYNIGAANGEWIVIGVDGESRPSIKK